MSEHPDTHSHPYVLGWVEISTGLVRAWQRVARMPARQRTRAASHALWGVSFVLSAVIAALQANGVHPPLTLDVVATLAALLGGVAHLPAAPPTD